VYLGLVKIAKNSLGEKYLTYFPFIFILTIFVLLSNLFGLIPFSFTPTAQLIVSLSLALSVFGAVNLLLYQNYAIRTFSLFLPSGTSFGLAFLLVPIEVVSFVFKPLSLAVRLFANIIAGHTLLKVIAGFSWLMIQKAGLFFLGHFLPLFVLVLLIGLELGVALIQAYVFAILVCIYLRESLYIH